jgi:electron transfer flavoprotein beta subunit
MDGWTNSNQDFSMKIAIMIKQVPETKSVKMDEKTGTVIRDGVESIINPLDLYAIELAIRIKESHPEAVLTGISMGPPKAADALKEAIAMGLDAGILLSDKALAGSDTWSTAYALAECARKSGDFSLVICGERATDGDTGQVGPEIASYLDMPVISYVNKFVDIKAGRISVHRQVEDGSEVLSCPLPCVITVVKEVSDPRLPTLRGKLKAKKTNIPAMKASDFGIETVKIGLEGSPTRVAKIFRPKVARQCDLRIAKDPSKVPDAIQGLVKFLETKEAI